MHNHGTAYKKANSEAILLFQIVQSAISIGIKNLQKVIRANIENLRHG